MTVYSRKSQNHIVEFRSLHNPRPYTPLVNPRTGTSIFGTVRVPAKWDDLCDTLPFILRAGDARSGAQHIYDRHHSELRKYKVSCVDDIPGFIAGILVHGAPVYIDNRDPKERALLAFRGGVKIVLGVRTASTPHLRVITAYPEVRVKGQPIARLSYSEVPPRHADRSA